MASTLCVGKWKSFRPGHSKKHLTEPKLPWRSETALSIYYLAGGLRPQKGGPQKARKASKLAAVEQGSGGDG